MKGDFSRITFDPAKQFCRVLMQQGRVQLDADWNEQAAIVLHEIRSLARAIIGPFGGSGDAFMLGPGDADHLFKIAAGTYFVDGIQCSADGSLVPLIPDDAKSKDDPKKIKASDYLAYLRVAERFITYLQDDSIREKALGEGVDTAARGKVVFAVTMLDSRGINGAATGRAEAINKAIAGLLPPEPRPRLQASLIQPAGPVDRCNVSPDALYRGASNQLYRVEIHDKGPAGTATFKWSRENGSVVFAAVAANSQAKQVTLASLGKDDRFTLQKSDWVELEDDDTYATLPRPKLVQVNSVTPDRNTVTLSDMPVANFAADSAKHPLLRRWEHGKKPWEGGLNTVQESVQIPLEEGIQVQFDKGGAYWPGDYWVIPARVALGGIDWPLNAFLPAHRPEYAVAPLATLTIGDDGKVHGDPADARSIIQTIAKPV
jgi:Family of unknown function (DUF6519)